MNILPLQSTDKGVVLLVKALPGSRRNEFRGIEHGRLKVAVTAVAEKGKANAAVIAFLAERLGLPKRCIELVRGGSSPEKSLLVHEHTRGQVEQFLRSFNT